jgi:endoglucanase
MHVFRGIRSITMAEYMIPEWAEYFRGKSFEELDELAASWKFENCVQRERLNETLKLYSTMKPDTPELKTKLIEKQTNVEGEGEEEGVFELSPIEKLRMEARVSEVILSN